jgi:hypothetical protein
MGFQLVYPHSAKRGARDKRALFPYVFISVNSKES